MTTPFLLRLDPDGERHRQLGHMAADALLAMCPDGALTPDAVDLVERRAQGAIRTILEPLGASHDDMVAAALWTAEFFGERVAELVRAIHEKAGHA